MVNQGRWRERKKKKNETVHKMTEARVLENRSRLLSVDLRILTNWRRMTATEGFSLLWLPILPQEVATEQGRCISQWRHLAKLEGTQKTLSSEVLGVFFVCLFFHIQKRGFPFHSWSSGKWNLYKTFIAHDGKHFLASNERIWPKSNCNKRRG